ncbi:MAG: hypothetical protein HYX74_07280 [Acidobacteria bacterium]|nr:hypothetical protein [Acidobacteriota bacterium]
MIRTAAVFKSGGTVGIGTEAPNASYKLHVAGPLKVDGNIAAKYQDIAEWVPASRPIPTATVVVLAPDSSNKVWRRSRGQSTWPALRCTGQGR